MIRTETDIRARKMIWGAISRIMETGGFQASIAGSGAELNRFKHYLEVLRGNESDPRDATPPGDNDIDPWVLPIFPGLRNVPWPNPNDYAWAPIVERFYEPLKAEAQRIRESFMTMSYASADATQQAKWRQGFVSAFGTRLPDAYFAAGTVPSEAHRLVDALPADDYAGNSHYAFADAFYSWLDPKYVVKGHHSADNFRVRCQLALDIPGDCYLKVAGEARRWTEGKVLLLDDSYWHEAVNNSERHRGVFLTDFWHPDLTIPERRALRAAFGKKEVRLLFLHMRALPQAIIDQFMPLFDEVDRTDAEISSRWTATPDTSHVPDVLAQIKVMHEEAGKKKGYTA